MKIPELHTPHHSKIEEFLALAELGRQARVIFHDLSNHFTSLNLTIRELENNLATERNRFQEYSRRSNETRAQIEYVANLLRSHIKGKDDPFNGHTIIKEVITLFEEKIKQNHISVVLKLDNNVYFQNGRRSFIHITTNLINNSIESVCSNSQKQKIIKVCLSQNTKRVYLLVSDTGHGITKQNQTKIFTSGFTTKKTGNGIGLSAVKEITKDTFNGSIEFQSTKKLTWFKIIIPKQNRKQNLLPVLKTNSNFGLLSESFKGLSNDNTI